LALGHVAESAASHERSPFQFVYHVMASDGNAGWSLDAREIDRVILFASGLTRSLVI